MRKHSRSSRGTVLRSAGLFLRVPVLAFAVLACYAWMDVAAAQAVRDKSSAMAAWRTEQGLPHNAVECLLQTRDGFLWMGTREGLARFDGLRFQVWDGRHPGFTSDAVTDLEEDASGGLWIATKHGLYLKRGDQFTRFTTAQGLGHDQVNDLCAGPDGTIWIATNGGLSAIRDSRLRHFAFETIAYLPEPKPNREVLSVLADHQGRVWIGSLSGLFQLNIDRSEFHLVWREELPPERRAQGAVRVIHEDPAGQLWLATDESLVRKSDDVFTRFGVPAEAPDVRATALRESGDGTIWLAKAGALYRVGPNGPAPAVEQPVAEPLCVTDILEDSQGDRWLGTRRGGLVRIKPQAVRVFTTEDGLCDNSVRSVCEGPHGQLWVATARGVAQLRGEQFEALRADPTTATLSCTSVFQDRSGDLWISEEPRGLHWFEPKPDGFLTHSINGPSSRVFEDRFGHLWIAGQDALCCLLTNRLTLRDPARGEFARKRASRWSCTAAATVLEDGRQVWSYRDGRWAEESKRPIITLAETGPTPAESMKRPPLPLDQKLSSYDVRAILEDRFGALWFGTFGGGLNRVRDGELRVITSADGLPGNFVQCLCEDAEGTLWVGTREGLGRLKGGQVSGVPPEHGLPPGAISAIVEDSLGRLWLGCRNGIFCVARQELNALVEHKAERCSGHLLDETDGLLSTDIVGGGQPGACKARDGRLWFPTDRGLARIDPARVGAVKPPPELFIESVRASDQSVTVAARASAPLRFRPGSGRYVEIAYTALDFDTPEKLRFRYRLDGVDLDWVEAGSRREARYTNLRPGQYRFRLTAENRHGVWSQPGASLSFRIEPFYYQSGWFWSGCLALAGLGSARLFRWRVSERQRIQDLEQARALAEERARIARDIHDDLGASLTQLHQWTALADSELPGDHPARAHVRRSRQAVEAIFRSMDEIVWAVNPGNDDLRSLLLYLRQYAAHYLAPTGIQLAFAWPEAVLEHSVAGQTRHQLFLMFKEALNNVVSHSGALRLLITARYEGCHLALSFTDNGRGFDPASVPAESNGLRNLRKRAEQLGGTIRIESRRAEGTTLHVEVNL